MGCLICSVSSCERKATRRGWCSMHYKRWVASGDPEGTADRRPRRRMKLGYVDVWAPTHPLARSDGYVREHRMVMFDAGFSIPPGSHVHHINGDKTDNRLENLEVLDASTHHRHHIAEAGVVVNQFGTWPVRSM